MDHSFDFNDKYLMIYKTCGKQYIDKTTNHFSSRQNNYTTDVRKAENGNMENATQNFLQCHFLQSDHSD